jgi:hypothetical protein
MLSRPAFQEEGVFVIELPPQFVEAAPAAAAEARRLIRLVGSAR